MSYLRNPSALYGFLNLSAIGGATLYLRSHLVHNIEEHEARMDELEGTLRGHIGIIEEALSRLEGRESAADRERGITQAEVASRATSSKELVRRLIENSGP